MTKVYRLEVLLIDYNSVVDDNPTEFVENARGFRDVGVEVKDVEEAEVEWFDEHPLNQGDTQDQAYRELFDIRDDDQVLAEARAPLLAMLEECRKQFLALPDGWGEAMPAGLTPLINRQYMANATKGKKP